MQQFDNATHGVSDGIVTVERKVTTVIEDSGAPQLHTGYTIQHGKTRLSFTDENWQKLQKLIAALG